MSLAAIHMGDVLGSQGANSLLVAAYCIGNVDERLKQALLLDEIDAPIRHMAVIADSIQLLPECLATVPAFVSPHLNQQSDCMPANGTVSVRGRMRPMSVQATDDAATMAGLWLGRALDFQFVFVPVEPCADNRPSREVKNVGHSSVGAAGLRGGLARWMRCLSHSRPYKSIFAHCSADSRIERWTSFWSSGSFGRPPGCLGLVSMPRIVPQKKNHKNFLRSGSL
ncbi:Uncharacterised protein [Ralstonia mannitolilytica]|nr:Uncharacterised protein [Ralstonia mannitolilytica]